MCLKNCAAVVRVKCFWLHRSRERVALRMWNCLNRARKASFTKRKILACSNSATLIQFICMMALQIFWILGRHPSYFVAPAMNGTRSRGRLINTGRSLCLHGMSESCYARMHYWIYSSPTTSSSRGTWCLAAWRVIVLLAHNRLKVHAKISFQVFTLSNLLRRCCSVWKTVSRCSIFSTAFFIICHLVIRGLESRDGRVLFLGPIKLGRWCTSIC